jgi:hypothetical protein
LWIIYFDLQPAVVRCSCRCAGPVIAALAIPDDVERLILLTDNTRK